MNFDVDPEQFMVSAGGQGDFLILANESPAVDTAMSQLGASIYRVGRVVVYYFNFPTLSEGCIALSGVARVGHRIVSGPAVVDECPTGSGQWIALLVGSETVEVRTDSVGMLPLFAGSGMCSNRLHLMALAMRAAGDLQIDNSALSSFFLQNTGFTFQLPVFRTPIQGVELLPAGDDVVISDSLVTRKAVQTEATGTLEPPEYQSLIEEAANEIASNVEAAANSFQSLSCGLTGGRESRIIYAALLATGKMGDVRFFTNERDNDVDVATGLVERFGGEYGPRGPSRYADRSSQNGIHHRNSVYFGLYHHMRKGSMFPGVPVYEPAQLLLTGGGGGFYKPVYNAGGSESAADAPYDDDALLYWLAEIRRTSLHSENLFQEMIDPFSETFRELPGSTLREKLYYHYLNFRNRFHFGASSALKPDTLIEFHPVVSPKLIKASRGLPPEEQRTGRAEFDVTRVLFEELAYCEYGKEQPDFSSSPYHSPSKFDGRTISLQYRPELSAAARSKPRSLRRPKVDLDLHDYMWQQVQANFDYLQTTRYSELVSASSRANAEWTFKRKTSASQWWYSITNSLVGYSLLEYPR